MCKITKSSYYPKYIWDNELEFQSCEIGKLVDRYNLLLYNITAKGNEDKSTFSVPIYSLNVSYVFLTYSIRG